MPPLPATFVPAGAANPPPEEVLGGVPNPPALLPAMIYKYTNIPIRQHKYIENAKNIIHTN